ncbi:MAG: hypothetical protein R3Y11_03910 [Pseudomonadota bacterium]
MPTQISIVNKALRMIGQSEISSLGDGTAAAARCDRAWSTVLDEVLRMHPWSHAMEWASLARLTTSPAFGFHYAYAMPSNCIRIVDVRSHGDLHRQGLPFEIVGTHVYTDAKPCLARYVVRNADYDYWPSDFCEALSCKLAADIAIPLARDGGQIMKAMMERYQMALDYARLHDTACRYGPEIDEASECSFITARH